MSKDYLLYVKTILGGLKMLETNDIKHLKYSCRRYLVGKDGIIYNCDGSVIKPDLVNGEWVVRLCWINGDKPYSVGMLVIITHCPMDLPEHLWEEINPLFWDGDSNHLHVDNLTYNFRSGKVPYEVNDDFFYIPQYTRYVINAEGVMLTAATGREKTWHLVKPDHIRNSKGGYYATRVVKEQGKNSVLLRHRAICLTFKPITKASDLKLVVNHRDGVPGNDSPDNLEWSTYSENNQHAHDNGLTGNKNTAVLVKNLKDGVVTKYANVKEAAKALGYKTSSPIKYRLRHCQHTLFTDYLQFKYDNGTDWPEIDTTKIPQRCKVGDTMAYRNVLTGTVGTFHSYVEGSALTGVDKQTIMIHIRDNQVIPFKGYNFRYYSDDLVWPVHHKLNIKTYMKYPVNPPDAVILIDHSTGEEMFFESRNEVAKYLNISNSYATSLVLENKLYLNRYSFKYHLLRENIK